MTTPGADTPDSTQPEDNPGVQPNGGQDDFPSDEGLADPVEIVQALLAERTDDLQRVQAEYVNYKRRVDRDRAVARERGAESVIRELMPVFDAIDSANAQEDMTPGFQAVANEVTRIGAKLGLVGFGAAGDEFDPNLHDALMQLPTSEYEPMHIAAVMQRGFLLNGVVIRPARVAVAAEPQQSTDAPTGS